MLPCQLLSEYHAILSRYQTNSHKTKNEKSFCMSEVYPDSKKSLPKRNNLKTLTNQGTHQIMLGFCSMKQLHVSPLPKIPKN